MKYQLGKVASITKGGTGIMKAVDGPYPMVTLAEERRKHNEFQFDAEAVIVPLISSTGHGHASMKRIHFQAGKFALGSILCAIIPHDPAFLNPRFLYVYLQHFKESLLVPLMKGAANVSLPLGKLAALEIEVPSPEKQAHIIELAERLEIRKDELEAVLANQETDTGLLRQAFLREAMQGQLVPQDPTDEPAAALLTRIREEKAARIKAGQLRKEKPLPLSEADEFFAIPETWRWCRVEEVCSEIVDCPHSTPIFLHSPTNYWCIDTTCINERGEIRSRRIVSEETYNDRIKRLSPQANDIIFAREGLIAQAVLVPEADKVCLGQRVMLLRPFEISAQYLRLVITSDYYRQKFSEMHRGMGAKHVNVKDVRQIIIPLPPLAEQHRIVAKLEQLLAQCDALEASIRTSRTHAEQLLQAALREALAPPVDATGAGEEAPAALKPKVKPGQQLQLL